MKRYGRNQRRKARTEISRLGAVATEHYERMVRAEQTARRLDGELSEWARRIVSSLGEYSSFGRKLATLSRPEGDGVLALQRRTEFQSALTHAYDPRRALDADIIRLFIHEVELKPDMLRDQLAVYLRRGRHDPIALALSAKDMDDMKYSKNPEFIGWLSRSIAEKLATYLEGLS